MFVGKSAIGNGSPLCGRAFGKRQTWKLYFLVNSLTSQLVNLYSYINFITSITFSTPCQLVNL